MKRQQIETKLRKLCGKHAHYEVRDNAPDADERTAMRAAHKEARDQRDGAQKRMNSRTHELQTADAEYQAALAAWREAGKRMQQTARFDSYRISAGTATRVAGFGVFDVAARGDTWPEVFAKLEGAR